MPRRATCAGLRRDLEKAIRLCGFDFAMLTSGSRWLPRSRRSKNLSPERLSISRKFAPRPDFVAFRADERSCRIADLRQARSPPMISTSRRGARSPRFGSFLHCAVGQGGHADWLIVVYRQEVHPFAQADCTSGEFRGAGGHRDGERAAAGELRARPTRSRRGTASWRSGLRRRSRSWNGWEN